MTERSWCDNAKLTTVIEKLPYPVDFADSSGTRVMVASPTAESGLTVAGGDRNHLPVGRRGLREGRHQLRHPTGRSHAKKTIVGGFWDPSTAAIKALSPDVIFVSSLDHVVRDHFAGGPCLLIQLESRSLPDLYGHIQLLGRIFAKEKRAEEICAGLQSEMRLIAEKVAKVPADQRKRVMRFMGRDRVMTPGDDSFQNDFIRTAGGTPPQLGKNGSMVEVGLAEWQRFNPQMIYLQTKSLQQSTWQKSQDTFHFRVFNLAS